MSEGDKPRPERLDAARRRTWQIEIPKAILPVLAGAVAGIVGGVLTYLTQMSQITATYETQKEEIARKYDNLDGDLNIKIMDLSLAILAGDKGDAEELKSDPGYVVPRTFAIRALQGASGIYLTPEEVKAWAGAGATAVSLGGLNGSSASWDPGGARVSFEALTSSQIQAIGAYQGLRATVKIAMNPSSDCSVEVGELLGRAIGLFRPILQGPNGLPISDVSMLSENGNDALRAWRTMAGCP